MASSGHEQQVKELVARQVGRCAVCGHGYDTDSVSILGQHAELWFFSLHCGECRTQGLVAVVMPESLTRAGEPVSLADVAAVRAFLATFDGDFRRLFRGGRA
jgi:hypothetical protein